MIWLMTVKDLQLMLRDWKALLITLLMPAILTVILGFSIGAFFNNEVQLEPAKVAVVSLANLDEDTDKFKAFINDQATQLELSDQNEIIANVTDLNFENIFLEEVLKSDAVKEFIEYEIMPLEVAEQKLSDSSLTAIIIIPEQFHYDMWMSLFTPFRNEVTMTIRKGAENEIKASIVETITKGFTDHLSVGVIGKQVVLEKAAEFNVAKLVYEQLGDFMETLMETDLDQTRIETTSIIGKVKITSFHYYAAAMAVMFMLFSAGYAASYCVNERFLFTYSRLKIAGISLFQILAARMFSCSLFTMFQLGFLIGFSTLVFHISWGSIAVVVSLTMMASVTVGCLAMLLSVINLKTGDERISNLFQASFIPLLALIGGSFVPNTGYPRFFKLLGDHSLNGTTLNGFLKGMQGFMIGDIQGELVILLIYSSIFLVTAAFIAKLNEV